MTPPEPGLLMMKSSSDNLRIYFAPCGLGLGHIARCEVIFKRLSRMCQIEAYFATYEEALAYARGKGLKVLEIPRFWLHMGPFGGPDLRMILSRTAPRVPPMALAQLRRDMAYMRALRPDVVVSDTRIVALLAAKLLRLPCVCLLNQLRIYVPRKKRLITASRMAESGLLAILGPLWASADELFVPDFPEPYTISHFNLLAPGWLREKLRLVGPLIDRRPEELPGQEELKARLGFRTDRPLVFAFISGTEAEKTYCARVLAHIFRRLDQDWQMVLSLGRPLAREVRASRGALKIVGWVEDFHAHLKASDVVVLRGGHGGVLKCMVYGKPMLIIPPPGHTEKMLNALRAKEIGVAEVLLQEDLNVKNVEKALSCLLQGERYRRKAEETARLASKLDAAGEIASAVLKLAS